MKMDDLISRSDVLDKAIFIPIAKITTKDKVIYRKAVFVDDIEKIPSAQQWIPCSEPPEEDGYYIVYAPTYSGGSSGGKENHNGIMFSSYKNGKWSIEHGYHKRPNCVRAWRPLPERYKE